MGPEQRPSAEDMGIVDKDGRIVSPDLAEDMAEKQKPWMDKAREAEEKAASSSDAKSAEESRNIASFRREVGATMAEARQAEYEKRARDAKFYIDAAIRKGSEVIHRSNDPAYDGDFTRALQSMMPEGMTMSKEKGAFGDDLIILNYSKRA